MFDTEFDAAAADQSGQWAEPLDLETARTVRRILMRLADAQENEAANEAAQIPYWQACPDSVRGSRAAARALRAVAESL